ncbi:uncharacterized protein [Elaeis guineensis]|uniref:Uncharacterized protein LOC105041089 isoform X1 n=1 Tax=Elaeis guineensis var. tenera TaxID=51953 RepID=A0A6I9QW54_ELAGV|nr:uncharacterized protein LOC105041089 isoform X1 [Elaeis guineensis]
MAIVTGDRYLVYLVRYVERNAGLLLDGALTLKLNPVGLRYVQSRLEALQELEGLLAGAPVDYLRAYVSDLGDHRALEQLRRILRLLTSLKVISVLPPPARDPTPVSLLPFGRLRVLELRGCDLSTSAAKGLLELRHTLEKLICYNSTDALRHVFASRIVDIKDSPAWNRLSFVSCAWNGLVLMDESLQLLPVVETLDLSRNRFAKVDNLRKCTKLRHLDLGFNHLQTIASFSEVSCRIVKLVLRNNALATLHGIENLKLLEGLDLSYNIISSFTELEILASLSCLQSLWLEGNPICCARWYRAHVFSFFSNPEKLKLDEKGISTREYWERHVIFSRRQKRPAGYGFYFPAKDDPEDENIRNTKKKKNSRLACIVDEEQRRYLSSEAVDQESLSCDSDSLKKEENAVSDSEIKIVSLINRAEYMKKERSVLWLREFKEWMDQTVEDKVDKSQCEEFEADSCKEMDTKQSKGHKPFGESSKHVADLAQTSEGGSSSNISESDISFIDTYAGGRSRDFFDSNGRALEPSVVNNGHVSMLELKIGVSDEKDQLRVPSRKPQNLSPLEVKGYFQYSSSTVKGGEEMEPKMSPAPLAAIDEIIGPRPSSIYPKSPPHYQEDILHRRLYWEEEFLQLSAESHSVGSSDSDTSCSDHALCEFNSSSSELDCSLIQTSINHVVGDPSDTLLYEDNHFEGREEKPCLGENSISSSDYFAQNDCSFGNQFLPTHNKACLLNEISADAGGMGKQKARQKIKRRVVSLSENFHAVAEFQKSNGILEAGNNDVKDANGQPSCNVNFVHHYCKEAALVAPHSHDKISTMASADGSPTEIKTNSIDSEQDDCIKNLFHMKIADSRSSETCEGLVHCGCIFQLGSVFQESDVALVRSSKNKLYILLIDATSDRRGTISKVLGCHRQEDIRKVIVGLGLQAIRVRLQRNVTYVFLTRTPQISEDLFHLLQICCSTSLSSGCSLQSWEQVQVKLLEKHIYGNLKMGIFMYSMLLFWHDSAEGESWLARSLFVIEGYILVCIENLEHFGSFTDDFELSRPYYSLDSCCPIKNILEMVVELGDNRCLTLTLDNVVSGNCCFADKIIKEIELEGEPMKVHKWKLKWFSEDTMSKFVALLKAIHSGVTASPLPVNCIC